MTDSDKKSILLAFIILLIQNRHLLGNVGLIIFYIVVLFYIMKDGLYRPIVKSIFFYFCPVFIALIIGLMRYPLYQVLRDFFYFLSPIFTIYAGVIIASRCSPEVLKKSIVIIGSATAIYYICNFFVTAGFSYVLDPRSARTEFELTVNATVLLSYTVLLYDALNGYKSNIWLLLLCIVTIYLSGSRTFLMEALIILALLLLPYIKKDFFKFVSWSLLAAIAVGLFFLVMPENDMTEMLLHSADEMTMKRYTSAAEINSNYRGYEAYQTMKTISDFPFFNKLCGGGFGTLVDIGTKDFVGFRYIPIMHNGYPYIILKSGYIGLVLIMIWQFFNIFFPLKTLKNTNYYLHLFADLAIIGVCLTLLTNFTVTGIFNSGYNLPFIFVGAYRYYYYNSSSIPNRQQ